jgi:hypothetical protein
MHHTINNLTNQQQLHFKIKDNSKRIKRTVVLSTLLIADYCLVHFIMSLVSPCGRITPIQEATEKISISDNAECNLPSESMSQSSSALHRRTGSLLSGYIPPVPANQDSPHENSEVFEYSKYNEQIKDTDFHPMERKRKFQRRNSKTPAMLTGGVTMALAELSKEKGTILHEETLGFEALVEYLYKKRRRCHPEAA